jgi:hypothetical protein
MEKYGFHKESTEAVAKVCANLAENVYFLFAIHSKGTPATRYSGCQQVR